MRWERLREAAGDGSNAKSASVDDFLPTTDETRIAYESFLEQFGRDDVILIAVDPPRYSISRFWNGCVSFTKTSSAMLMGCAMLTA